MKNFKKYISIMLVLALILSTVPELDAFLASAEDLNSNTEEEPWVWTPPEETVDQKYLNATEISLDKQVTANNDNDVFYKFTAPSDGIYSFESIGNYDTGAWFAGPKGDYSVFTNKYIICGDNDFVDEKTQQTNYNFRYRIKLDKDSFVYICVYSDNPNCEKINFSVTKYNAFPIASGSISEKNSAVFLEKKDSYEENGIDYYDLSKKSPGNEVTYTCTNGSKYTFSVMGAVEKIRTESNPLFLLYDFEIIDTQATKPWRVGTNYLTFKATPHDSSWKTIELNIPVIVTANTIKSVSLVECPELFYYEEGYEIETWPMYVNGHFEDFITKRYYFEPDDALQGVIGLSVNVEYADGQSEVVVYTGKENSSAIDEVDGMYLYSSTQMDFSFKYNNNYPFWSADKENYIEVFYKGIPAGKIPVTIKANYIANVELSEGSELYVYKDYEDNIFYYTEVVPSEDGGNDVIYTYYYNNFYRNWDGQLIVTHTDGTKATYTNLHRPYTNIEADYRTILVGKENYATASFAGFKFEIPIIEKEFPNIKEINILKDNWNHVVEKGPDGYLSFIPKNIICNNQLELIFENDEQEILDLSKFSDYYDEISPHNTNLFFNVGKYTVEYILYHDDVVGYEILIKDINSDTIFAKTDLLPLNVKSFSLSEQAYVSNYTSNRESFNIVFPYSDTEKYEFEVCFDGDWYEDPWWGNKKYCTQYVETSKGIITLTLTEYFRDKTLSGAPTKTCIESNYGFVKIYLYEMLDGKDSVWSNDDQCMVFRSSADMSTFLYLKIDEKVITNTKYKVTQGSTIVTFNKSVLDELNDGSHSIDMVSKDNGHTYTDFTVLKSSSHVHTYDEPIYEWNDDFSKCTATAICKENSVHQLKETVNASFDKHTNEAGFTVVNINASFSSDIFEAQSKTIYELATKDKATFEAKSILEALTKDEIAWSSSNEKVATVDNNGNVTALTYGKTIITASLKNNSEKAVQFELQTKYYDVLGSSIKSANDYKYYYAPVYWAADNKITTGYENVYFGVGKNCTRESVMIFLWRLAGSPTPKKNATKYFTDLGDYKSTSATNKAVAWAYEQGISKGYGNGTFGIGKSITRKDVLIMLYRIAGKPSVSGSLKFTDCTAYKKGTDTYSAILWGSKKGITNGYSDGTFKPNNACLREQIITFLYRYSNL